MLGGGGSLGAMQAGMLQALYEEGIVPDLFVGTSAGALNAAFVASRPQVASTASELGDVWRGIRRERIFPIGPRAVLAGIAGHADHLVSDQGLRTLIGSRLEAERLEQLMVPTHLVSYDLLSGEEVLLSSGGAGDAVLAAASIPGVLPPVRWQQRLLVDGGIVNNTPISHAVRLGAERVYVLPTHDAARAPGPVPRGALNAGIEAVRVLVGQRLAADIALYSEQVELIVLPAGNRGAVQMTDFSHADDLIREALTGARRALRVHATEVVS